MRWVRGGICAVTAYWASELGRMLALGEVPQQTGLFEPLWQFVLYLVGSQWMWGRWEREMASRR